MYEKLKLPLIDALPGKLFPTERFLRDAADMALQDTVEFPALVLVDPIEPDDIVA